MRIIAPRSVDRPAGTDARVNDGNEVSEGNRRASASRRVRESRNQDSARPASAGIAQERLDDGDRALPDRRPRLRRLGLHQAAVQALPGSIAPPVLSDGYELAQPA